jgi:hypothetical protein
MKAAFAFLVAGIGLLAPAAALAHHSFAAEYDAKKPVTLKGTVTKVEWTNPHARFYVDVKDESGNVTNWNLELASPNVLTRNGWTRHSLNVGRSGDRGRRPSQGRIADGQCQKRVLADGKKVFSGAAGDAVPNQ